MEIIREDSPISMDRQIYMYGTLALIVICFAYEAYQTYTYRSFSVLGWGYSFVFLGMWIWRCIFRYTYILRDDSIEVISKGLGIKRSYSVKLADVESVSSKYVRSFFRKTEIGHYVHRYSSVDGNTQRILVFHEGKDGKKLAGLIFKCSDKFFKSFRQVVPKEKFIDFE